MARSSRFFIGIVAAVLAVAVVGFGIWSSRSRRELPAEHRETISLPAAASRVLVTSDARFIAAAGGTGAVVVLDVAGRKTVLHDRGSAAAVTMLTMSRDGLLLCGDAAGAMRGWQAPEFQTQSFESPRVPMTCAAFIQAADDARIELGLADGRLLTIRESGTKVRPSGHYEITAIVATADGRSLITAGTEGGMIWQDSATTKPTRRVDDHNSPISILKWSDDMRYLVSADLDGLILIRSADRWAVAFRLQQPDAVSALLWRGDRLVTGSWDGRIRVWRTTGSPVSGTVSPELVAEIDTTRPVVDLAWGPAPDTVLSVSGRSAIDVWQLP